MDTTIIKSTIEKIIKDIPQGYFFDSHTIISILIKEYSDVYLGFVREFPNPNSDGLTLAVHGQIGIIIKEFDGALVEKQEPLSWSENIHNNFTKCACWRKIV